MRLRNVLIAVNDMDRAIRFYKEIFGLQVILDQDGNVIMTEGLVLQDAAIWKKFLSKDLIPKNNTTELYFEEPDMEGFVKKLKESEFEIEYVNELMTHSWGQKVLRFYDLDGNLIEVGTPVNSDGK
jgi:catechol 2,3-dioxygenase-like lactoylglutathione lyase family enzyme